MKHCIFIFVLFICSCSAFAQNFTGNQSNQAPQQMVVISNYPIISNLDNNFNNVSDNNNNPIQQQQMQSFNKVAETNENIEPSLDNGFHIRFQIASSVKENSSTSSSTTSHKAKKSFNKNRFNRRNRIKNFLPKRKVSYNTYLCSRF